MNFSRDDLMLAAYIARSSNLAPCVIGARMEELKKLSRRHHSAALVLCNGPAARLPAAYKRLDQIEEAAAAIAEQFGLPMGHSRDPRGALAFRFRLPDGRSNSFGGEDWLF